MSTTTSPRPRPSSLRWLEPPLSRITPQTQQQQQPSPIVTSLNRTSSSSSAPATSGTGGGSSIPPSLTPDDTRKLEISFIEVIPASTILKPCSHTMILTVLMQLLANLATAPPSQTLIWAESTTTSSSYSNFMTKVTSPTSSSSSAAASSTLPKIPTREELIKQTTIALEACFSTSTTNSTSSTSTTTTTEEVSVKYLNALFQRFSVDVWIRVIKVIVWSVDLVPRLVGQSMVEAFETTPDPYDETIRKTLFSSILEDMNPLSWMVLASLCALLQRDRKNRKFVCATFGPALFLPKTGQSSYRQLQTASSVLDLLVTFPESIFAKATRGTTLNAELFFDEDEEVETSHSKSKFSRASSLSRSFSNLLSGGSNLLSGGGGGGSGGNNTAIANNSGSKKSVTSTSGRKMTTDSTNTQQQEQEEFKLETLPDLQQAVRRLEALKEEEQRVKNNATTNNSATTPTNTNNNNNSTTKTRSATMIAAQASANRRRGSSSGGLPINNTSSNNSDGGEIGTSNLTTSTTTTTSSSSTTAAAATITTTTPITRSKRADNQLPRDGGSKNSQLSREGSSNLL
jgi:hypothetical protein